MPSRRRPAGGTPVVAAEAEGFPPARSHRTRARREAQPLCDSLPWLSSAQTEDLTRHHRRPPGIQVVDVDDSDDPDAETDALGGFLPGLRAELAGPTFEEWFGAPP
ncbi:hypothetical protein ACIF80_14950 [Streptomyces sp. NPDC085927]|uniref:hypothetical protein n=1 Tax=Streptomyces sp. NPDC085927 TaxID=3365738 RepID=UPI0037CFBC8E